MNKNRSPVSIEMMAMLVNLLNEEPPLSPGRLYLIRGMTQRHLSIRRNRRNKSGLRMNAASFSGQLMTPYLKENQLFSEQSRRFIATLGQLFIAVSGLILEYNFQNPEDTTVDISYRFLKEEGEFLLLSKFIDDVFDGNGPAIPAEWELLKSFVTCCLNDAAFSAIQVIWLEFDQDRRLSQIPVPGVFFDIADTPNNGDHEIYLRAIELLSIKKYSAKTRFQLKKALASRPNEGRVLFVGSFLSRPQCPLRVNRSILFASLPQYFLSIGVPPIPSIMQSILDKLVRNGIQRGVLNMNINNQISTDPGIEISANQDCDWERLVALLIEDGWLEREVAVQILEWPGFHPDLANAALLQTVSLRQLPAYAEKTVYIRRINHIKLTVKANKKVAKIYLFEGYGWLY